MKNPFRKQQKEIALVECDKGHKFPSTLLVRYVKYKNDYNPLYATKRMCPICFIEFFDKNISGIKERSNVSI